MFRNIKVITFGVLIALSMGIRADGFADKSSIDTPTMAKCTAAAMKINSALFGQWYDALLLRYTMIYKDSKTEKEIESYTLERILDKRRALNRDGIDSKRAYSKYFSNNCEGEL